jgi:ubiquinone biosynthesis protein Coq4
MLENYLDPDCNITLRQALDKYYAQNPGFYKPDQFESSYNNILFAHDVCHIVFGCGTQITEESKLEIWTLLATNLSFKSYYNDYLAPLFTMGKDELKEVGSFFFTFFTLSNLIQYILVIPEFVKIFFAAKKVNPKWDYCNYQVHFDRSISDIRQEFRIQVI